MSVPTHSIHSIHSTFAGVSSYSKFSHAGIVIEAPKIDKIPPGLARAAWRTAPVLILPPLSSSFIIPCSPSCPTISTTSPSDFPTPHKTHSMTLIHVLYPYPAGQLSNAHTSPRNHTP
ncbi:hypothetical protein AZE42_13908 [Rhizopogon vesiculosus]|uniref:Uncharacterized protein n=1 Tax=Rhizopogon vesiculosus TaxID=180088 RepID=A0A1J8QX27_9AGAM|nr:hypothetical protein AZE42_13908 [Rhizopogon vesiculosus]